MSIAEETETLKMLYSSNSYFHSNESQEWKQICWVICWGWVAHDILVVAQVHVLTISPRLLWCPFTLSVSWQFAQQFQHLVFCELYPYAFQVIVQLNKVNLLTFQKFKVLTVEKFKNDDSSLWKKLFILC